MPTMVANAKNRTIANRCNFWVFDMPQLEDAFPLDTF
jgi:hypothetical protein